MAAEIINIFNSQAPKFDEKSLKLIHLKLLTNQTLTNKYHSIKNRENELLLFHGTKQHNIDVICQNGFDTTKYVYSGHIGRGSYFSTLIQQSIYYTLNCPYEGDETDFNILVCKVNIGKCAENLNRCENVNGNKKDGYDTHSTVYTEQTKQGSINGYEYCVFDSKRILPLYLMCMKVV